MELDLSDWIPQDIYLTGEFEGTTSNIAAKLLNAGDTAVDVGANIGWFSLLFAQCVGKSGRVFAYEPMPVVASKLKRNLKLNQVDNVSVSNVALSDHDGIAPFFPGPESNTGRSSLLRSQETSGSFEVQLSPFDTLVEDFGRITLVKIDVEGAELQVLRGMENLLRNARPNLLLEVTDKFLREMGDSAESMLHFLTQLGYVCYVIGDGRVTILDQTHMELPWQWNALLTPGKLFGEGAVFS